MPDQNNIADDIDETTGVSTTGHEWDGIKELDNPMPRWWLWTFFASILFALGYVIYYPAIPLINGSTMGISGETSRLLLKQETDIANLKRAEKIALLENATLLEIQQNNNLNRFAVRGGKSLFKVNCTQCHGSGAAGGPGYPNLNDDEWIWGGDLKAIYTSIAHGIRNGEDDDERYSEMPAFGTDKILDRGQIASAAEYVLKLSNQSYDEALAQKGSTVFEDNCTSCHGATGLGDRDIGAPSLVDEIWLYGGSRTQITSQITSPKSGVMPPWKARLGDSAIKQLAIYVYSLGGGENTKVE